MTRKEQLLTKSAKEELESYLAQERERILDDAFHIASKNVGESQEISLRDILEATDKSKYEAQKKKNIEYRRKRMSMLLAMSGVLYALIGILFYLYQNTKFSVENDFGLIIAAVGILVTFMAFFYNQLYLLKSRRTESDIERNNFSSLSDMSIVERWTTIESLTRNIIEKETNENPKSFNQIFDYLTTRNIFNESEFKDFRELLMMRNKISHESISLSDTKRKDLIITADRLIDRLEKEKNTAHNNG